MACGRATDAARVPNSAVLVYKLGCLSSIISLLTKLSIIVRLFNNWTRVCLRLNNAWLQAQKSISNQASRWCLDDKRPCHQVHVDHKEGVASVMQHWSALSAASQPRSLWPGFNAYFQWVSAMFSHTEAAQDAEFLQTQVHYSRAPSDMIWLTAGKFLYAMLLCAQDTGKQ